MKRTLFGTTATLIGLSVLLATPLAFGQTTSVITGDLVVTNAETRQFRLVDRPGTYTAPAGTALESLDGRRVTVDLSANGTVLHVADAPVAVPAVTHGFSTVRGQVVVVDATHGTFTIAGDDRTYRAPAGKDITPYAGKVVELRLNEDNHVVNIDLISSAPAQPVQPVASASCEYRGQTFSAGAAVCQAGTQYRCDGNRWLSLGTTCVPPASGDVATVSRPRPCEVGGATVATGSSVCREGLTARCDDGMWINVGTPCR